MLKRVFKFVAIGCLSLISIALILCASWYRSDIPVTELEAKYFTPQSSYLTVQDSKVHVRQQGAGPTIFLLHGSFASLHTWDGWEKELSKNFKTISLDFPGHGLTGPNAANRYSTDDYEALVFALADQLKIDTFYVAGNSMGGQVAWKMALHRPERVKKLILVDAAGYWRISTDSIFKTHNRPFIFKLLQNDWVASTMIKITPRFLFKINLRQVYGNPGKVKNEEVDRFYDLLLREGNRASTMQRLRQPGKDLQDSIKHIQVSTLIIWGAKDAWIPVANAYHFNKDIKTSETKIFPQAGHVPMQEIPNETVKSAIDFLQNKPRENGQQQSDYQPK
jgi:pimeloyl-ACP methyl ester carboxylesterase